MFFLFKIFLDLKPFDELYADGVEAYWNENWEGCIKSLEDSLFSYRSLFCSLVDVFASIITRACSCGRLCPKNIHICIASFTRILGVEDPDFFVNL